MLRTAYWSVPDTEDVNVALARLRFQVGGQEFTPPFGAEVTTAHHDRPQPAKLLVETVFDFGIIREEGERNVWGFYLGLAVALDGTSPVPTPARVKITDLLTAWLNTLRTPVSVTPVDRQALSPFVGRFTGVDVDNRLNSFGVALTTAFLEALRDSPSSALTALVIHLSWLAELAGLTFRNSLPQLADMLSFNGTPNYDPVIGQWSVSYASTKQKLGSATPLPAVNGHPGSLTQRILFCVKRSVSKPYGAVLRLPDDSSTLALAQWQLASYSTLRDAAYARYVQVQETIRQKRAELARQIETAADGPTLREMEREQLMRSVLEWLFPGFGAVSSSAGLGVAAGLTDESWRRVMEYGEYIKFVHSAVDWANMTYVLYPYFWGSSAGSAEKLFLTHSDPLHREFLRAGAVRVILAIQPGFESAITSLLDEGRLRTIPASHRFSPVVKAVVNANAEFAKTANSPAKKGDDAAALRSRGTHIGSWIEYTPTSALEISVSTSPVQAR